MKKTVLALLLVISCIFAGCGKATETDEKSNKKNITSKTSSVETVKEYDWQSNSENYKLIAFTFDDAPSYPSKGSNPTTYIIQTLNRFEGAGTLFVIGRNLDKNGALLLKYAVRNGFELANHSYSHEHMGSWNEAQIRSDIERNTNLIKSRVGVKTKYFRPPFFDDCSAMYNVLGALNMPCIKGSKDAALHDGVEEEQYNADFIYETCVNGAYDGQIVALHGYNKYTAMALPKICETLYNEGYRFVTLSQLFEYKGVSNIPTNRYIYDNTCE